MPRQPAPPSRRGRARGGRRAAGRARGLAPRGWRHPYDAGPARRRRRAADGSAGAPVAAARGAAARPGSRRTRGSC
nr:hypothetical protein [Angustibacter aerolatus]